MLEVDRNTSTTSGRNTVELDDVTVLSDGLVNLNLAIIEGSLIYFLVFRSHLIPCLPDDVRNLHVNSI